ncbi:uncharacterized protein LOC143252483 isoform X2 [Tachypleus tridentatus]|uniref:uncharacterized protein LOC143252483 isoform X2 n=1 Tax=Tachypleus tridentatus TaxID=6853 RepID=UPI003FD1C96D
MTSIPSVAQPPWNPMLPPVRRTSYSPGTMMSTVSDDPISLWLRLGALEKLEQVLLDGYGKQLYGKTSRIPEVNKFLKQIPVFQAKIEEIHRAVVKGQLREVQHLIDRKKLAFSRDHMGASTLHKAVLYEQTEIMEYLLDRYSSVIHARDHQGRTPLHYAAVLQDDGKIYNMLLEAGADQKATDMHGHRPDYYLQNQGELTLQQLKEGAVINRAKRLKPKPQPKLNVNDSYRGFSAKPAGNKVQIKELIDQGSLETLEELLLQGHGDKLLGETSNNERIQEFLTMVPIYMERINEIHRAVVRGRLRDVQSLLDRKNLAMGRDQLGATPLHKAVMYGHFDIAEYIVNNYPACRDCKDVDGHTALHYASVLPDGKQMYNMLIGAGVNPGIPDGKGKPSEYYLQYPEQLNLTQLIKRSQRANANFIANTANRFLSKHSTNPVVGNSGQKRRFLTSNNVKKVTPEVQGEDVLEEEEESKDHLPSLFEKRTLFGTRPQVPIPQLQRLDVTSANIRKWVQDEDLDKLEGAVIEGYGEKLIHVETSSEGVQTYINETVPKIIERIEAIHAAVAEGNISELQSHLDKQNFALAKDHMGMTPLHRAVILGHMDVVKYILEKFPETVNAKDKDGRTALHYAAAVPRKDGKTMFKMLLQAGADIRIRDQHGRTPEYYRTHHLSNNFEHSKAGGTVNQVEKIIKDGRKGQVIPKMVIEKTNKALLNGDVAELHEIAGDGYGHYLLGKTSWHENVRQYLKELPGLLESNASVQQALRAGDVEIVKEHVTKNEQLLNFRDENGEMVVHQAITHNQFPILQFLVDQFPQTVKHRDRGGRTGLHIAAIQKNEAAYELLLSKGGDPKVLDQKGRTAEYYLKSGQKSDQTMNRSFKVVSQGQQELSNTIRAEAEGQEESNDVPEAAAEGQEELNDVPEPGAEGEEESNDVSVVASEEQEESNDVPEAETEGQEESNDVPDAGAEGQEESNDAPEVSAEGQDESNDVPDAGAEGVEESNDVPEAAAEGEEESNDVPEAETEGQEESNDVPDAGAEGQEESNDAPEVSAEGQDESNDVPDAGAEGVEESNDVPEAAAEGEEESNDVPEAETEGQEESNDVPDAGAEGQEESNDAPEVSAEGQDESSDVPDAGAEGVEESNDVPEAAAEEEEESNDVPEPGAEGEEEPNDLSEVAAEGQKESNNVPDAGAEGQEESNDVPDAGAEGQEESNDTPEVSAEGQEESNDAPEVSAEGQDESNDVPDAGAEGVEESNDVPEAAAEGEEESNDVPEPGAEGEEEPNDLSEVAAEGQKESNNVPDAGAEGVEESNDAPDAGAEGVEESNDAPETAAEGEEESNDVPEPGAEGEEDTNDVSEVAAEGEEVSNDVPEAGAEGVEKSNDVSEVAVEGQEESNDVREAETEGQEESNNVPDAGSEGVEVEEFNDAPEAAAEGEEESNDVPEAETEGQEESNDVPYAGAEGQEESNDAPEVSAEGQEESNNVPDAEAEGVEESNDASEAAAEGEEESNDVSEVAAEGQEESNDVPGAETEGQEESNNVPDAGFEGVEVEEFNDAPEAAAEGEEESNDVPEPGAEGEEESNDVPEAETEGQEESNDVPEAETEGQEKSNDVPYAGAEGQEESNDAPEVSAEGQEESNDVPEAETEGQEKSNDVPYAGAEGQEESNDAPEVSAEGQEESNDVPDAGAEGVEESNDAPDAGAEGVEESNDVPEAETEGQEESNDVPDAGAEGQEESNDAPEVSAEGQEESNNVPEPEAEGVEESNDAPEPGVEREEESYGAPEPGAEGQEESNGAPESGAEGQEESNDAPEPGVEREEESNGAPEPGAEGQEESNDVPGAETEGQEESNDFPKAASEEHGEPSHEGTSEEPNEAHRSTDSSKQNEYLKTLIDNWIEEADLMRLEHVIIAGQGDKLIGRSSDNKQVQEFLDLVPAYMARIRGVHEAVVRGSLTEVKQVITRKRFALSRDHLGASPLHLAVLHGHSDVMAYIISQFPETMDGPDNEGRTPLHYAAVVPDGGKYFSILIHAGADNGVKDKYGRIPQDYLDQPDLLTIRDLLEGYKITENLHRKPSIVEVWHRPPTQEIEQNLTPVYSDEEESPLQAEQTTAEALIFPLLTTASEEDNQYLLDTVADVLVAGIREVSLLKPRDPIAYLATWLYSYASHRASRDKGNQSDNMTPEFEKVLNQQTRNLQSRMKKLTATANLGQRSENLEFLEEEKEDDEENSIEIEDQTKMKDEAGQTVLHFAAVQTHQNDSFYNLIVQTEILLAERDVNYSTARDIAEQSGYLENVQTIDQYVIDAFIDGNAGLLHMLMHEGYDHLLNVTDKKGKDIKTILEENNLQKSLSLLTDLAEFEKKREELHTYIRNSYVEGISNLSKQDRSLVTAKNTKGRCSLHVAVLLEKLNIIKILVDVNASSVHVPDNMGRTPLHYAMATVSVTQIARVLIEAGALRTTQDVKMHSVSYYYINGEDIQKLMEEEENQSS